MAQEKHLEIEVWFYPDRDNINLGCWVGNIRGNIIPKRVTSNEVHRLSDARFEQFIQNLVNVIIDTNENT